MSNLNRIIRSKQDELDAKADAILSGLIDHRHVKILPINGNYPGIDWLIQFVDGNGNYTSKYLFHQLKGKGNAKKLSFSCEVTHLRHWSESSLPVIFILVDINSGKAYWENIDWDYVSKLDLSLSQKTKTIHFDPNKEISRGSNYIDEWFKIANAVASDELVQSDWDIVIRQTADNLKHFVGLLYLIGPVAENNKEAMQDINNLMEVDSKALQLLIYEGLKNKLLKSVGGVFFVADEKYGLGALTSFVDTNFDKVLGVWKVVRDTKQASTVLKRLLYVEHPNAEKFLNELTKSFEVIVKDWKNNDVVFETINLLDEVPYKTSGSTLKIVQTIVNKTNPPEARKLKAGSYEYDGKSYEEVLLKSLDLARKIRYFKPKEILRLLWRLSKSGDTKIKKKATEIIENLAEYDLHALRNVGFLPQLQLLEALEKLDDKELVSNIEMLQTVGRELMKASFESHEMTDYKTFTWSTGALKVSEELKKLRNRTRLLLQKAYSAIEDYNSRRTILQTLIEVTYPPRQGIYGQDIEDMVIEDANRLVDFYIGILGTTDKALYRDIEKQLYWLRKRFTPGKITNLDKLSSLLQNDIEYELFRVFIGYDYDFDEDRDWQKAKESRETKIQGFVKDFEDANYDEWKGKIISITKSYTDIYHGEYQYFSTFLFELGKQKPNLAIRLINELESGLKPFILHVVAGVWESSKKELLEPFISDCLVNGKYLSECAYIFTYTKTLDEELLEKVYKKAIETNDFNALINIIRVCTENYHLKKSTKLKHILLGSIKELTRERNTNWVQRIIFRDHTIFTELIGEEVEIVFTNLVEANSIDYDAEEVLVSIAEKYPEKIIALFKRRVAKHLIDKDYFKYDAIPYELHKLHEPLQRSKKVIIQSIFKWYGEKDALYHLEAGHLLKIIFPSFDDELVESLNEMIKVGSKQNAIIVLTVLRAYKGEQFLHEVVKEFIKKYLSSDASEDYRAYKTDLFIILSQTGVVWGEYGVSNAYEAKRDAVKEWENETNESIKRFLIDYKAYLGKNIEFEKKRADVDVELIKQNLI